MTTEEFDETMSVATGREMEANAFYSRVAKAVRNTDVKRIFEELAGDEMGHFELLSKFKSDSTLPLKIAAPGPDYHVAEATELPAFSDDMQPREAIALAMKKEQQAVEFYRGMAARASDPVVRDIFVNLANMELAHKQKLENAFVEVGYPEAF